MIRVVLDTNVLVSSLLFENGRLAWIRHSLSRVNPLGRFATTKLAGEGPQVVAGDNLGAATRKLSHPATRSLIGTGFS
jgi:hypothetical protein